MKKILLLSSAAILLASGVNAMEIRPYVSAKMNYSMMRNTGTDLETYANSNGTTESFKEKTKIDDDVLGGSLAVGIKACNLIRTEIEGNLHKNAEKTESGEGWSDKYSIKNNSLMWNTYVDIDTGTDFTPYIGGGIGIAHLKATDKYTDSDFPGNNAKYSQSKNHFAWQIGAGTAYDLTKNVALDLGYRYFDAGTSTLYSESEPGFYEEKQKLKSRSHEVYLGLRYTF